VSETKRPRYKPPKLSPRAYAPWRRHGGVVSLTPGDTVARAAKLLELLPPPPRLAPVLNRVIDSVLHRLAEEEGDPGVYLLDSALHTLVELGDQLADSIAKSVRYNLPRVLRLAERARR